MLSEGFFDILAHASGAVVGKLRRALAAHNLLSGTDLPAGSRRGSCRTGRLGSGCSHPVLARPSLCGDHEGAASALN